MTTSTLLVVRDSAKTSLKSGKNSALISNTTMLLITFFCLRTTLKDKLELIQKLVRLRKFAAILDENFSDVTAKIAI